MLKATFRLMQSRPLHSAISQKLGDALAPVSLVVRDDSHMHRGHAGVQGAATEETHFTVEIVSDKFNGVNRVQRQRMINDLLRDEFNQGLHALALSCKTPQES